MIMLVTMTAALLSGMVFLILRTQASGSSFPPPLSAKQETSCLQALQQGDAKAREKLIAHNLRLVAHIVKKYYAAPCDQDDLISIGTIGLIKAVDTYNPEKKIRLATYAAKCIENEILMHFRSLRKRAGDISLSEALDTDKDGNTLSLIDVLSCEDIGLQKVEEYDRFTQIAQILHTQLTARERKILYRRYGLDGKSPQTQREIAIEQGISRSYISRIEKKALLKLKSALERL